MSKASLANATAPTVTASTTTLKRLDVSWSAVPNASSYTVKLYAATGTGDALATVSTTGTTRALIASDFNFDDLTLYTVSVQAIGGTNYQDSTESSKTSARTRGLPQSITVDASGVVDATGSWIDGTWYTATLGTSRVTPTAIQNQMGSANATLTTAGAITVSSAVTATNASRSLTINSTAGDVTVTGSVSVAGNFAISGAAVTINANQSTTNGGNITITPSGDFTGTGALNSAGSLTAVSYTHLTLPTNREV